MSSTISTLHSWWGSAVNKWIHLKGTSTITATYIYLLASEPSEPTFLPVVIGKLATLFPKANLSTTGQMPSAQANSRTSAQQFSCCLHWFFYPLDYSISIQTYFFYIKRIIKFRFLLFQVPFPSREKNASSKHPHLTPWKLQIYFVTWQKGIQLEDGIKTVHRFTLKIKRWPWIIWLGTMSLHTSLRHKGEGRREQKWWGRKDPA